MEIELLPTSVPDYAALWALEDAGVDERWRWRPTDWRRMKERGEICLYQYQRHLAAAFAVLSLPGRTRGIRGTTYELVRFVVAPACRRQGVGRQILSSLHRQAVQEEADIVATVPDELHEVHLFLRSCGWRALGTVPSLDAGLGDAIRFRAGG